MAVYTDQIIKQCDLFLPLLFCLSFLRACRDTKGDKFLELAIDGRADLILTGDQNLLVLRPFRGIPILTPDEYLAEA